MELCECNLKTLIKQNPVLLRDKYHYCFQVATGVSHLHNKSIIHGDLKTGKCFGISNTRRNNSAQIEWTLACRSMWKVV